MKAKAVRRTIGKPAVDQEVLFKNKKFSSFEGSVLPSYATSQNGTLTVWNVSLARTPPLELEVARVSVLCFAMLCHVFSPLGLWVEECEEGQRHESLQGQEGL